MFLPHRCAADLHEYIDRMRGPMDGVVTIDWSSLAGLSQRVGAANSVFFHQYLRDTAGNWDKPAFDIYCYGYIKRDDLHAFCRGEQPGYLSMRDSTK